ncbi:MAG: alpha/beta fold hydrolase [Acidobacteria bacterium]|nr:alpha/beta fold hydrolase [Acidobacteriota bacterium]
MNTPLIYLHGFASGPASTKARYFRERFAGQGIALEVPDLARGDFEHLTVSGQLAVVEEVAAGRAVSLIGSSMGGYLAALYAARHPEVRRIVLLAPAFGFARRWPESLGESALASWRETGWLPLYHYADRQERRVHYRLLEDGRLYEDYPAVSQPSLVFHGRHDAVVPYSFSEEFARRNPAAHLEILDSGHELTDMLDHLWREASRFVVCCEEP